MPQPLTVILFVLLSMSMESNQGIGRHDRPDERYLELATRDEFAPVVPLESEGGFLGSAVLIAPDWLITAKHVVSELNGSSVIARIGDAEVAIQHIERHPTEDLALLELSSSNELVSPARVLQEPVEIGTEVTSVGFGVGGKGTARMGPILSATPADAGIKRAGTNTVDELERGLILLADFDHPSDDRYNMTGSSSAMDLEYLPMKGDSGGGLFCQIDGQWYVVGVTLSGTTPRRDVDNVGSFRDAIAYGWIGQWYGIYHARAWIQSIVGN